MKQFIFTFFFLAFRIYAVGQILDQRLPVFEERPFFNQSWVEQQGIKRISADILLKKDQRPIRQTGLQLIYHFNSEGALIQKTETRSILGRVDTLQTFYQYDSENELIKVIVKDAYGYYATNYKRNAKGLLLSVYHTREKLIRDKQFESIEKVWEDTVFTTEKNDTVLRQVFCNNLGKPYKDIYKRFDKKGCLVIEREMNRIGGEFSEIAYNRNPDCAITSWKYKGTYNQPWQERKVQYNELNLISEESFFNKGALSKYRKYTYTANLQLELFLERSLEKQEMRILEFKYEYY